MIATPYHDQLSLLSYFYLTHTCNSFPGRWPIASSSEGAKESPGIPKAIKSLGKGHCRLCERIRAGDLKEEKRKH